MSRRLHALHVGNFKAFADTQRIPIKPITLVFGPNSAGKSSFIHSLALAHEAQFGRDKHGRARLDVHHTDIGGSSIDLGGFRQFVHRGRLDKRTEWGAEIAVASLQGDPRFQSLRQLLSSTTTLSVNVAMGLELSEYGKPALGAEPRVEGVEILADGVELLRMSRRKAGLRMDRLASDHAVFRQLFQAIVETQTTSADLREEDSATIENAIADLLPILTVRVDRFLPSRVEFPRLDGPDDVPADSLFPVSRGNRGEDLTRAIRFLLPRSLNDLIKGISDALTTELKGLRYLGPLRNVPPRHVVFQQQQDENWMSSGDFAWELLRRDKALREKVNQWLGGHPGVSTSDVLGDETLRRSAMKTPYVLTVERFFGESVLHDGLRELLFDQPLSSLERRELLNGSNTTEEIKQTLSESVDLSKRTIDKELARLSPWVEKLQSVKSAQERESVLEQAMESWQSLRWEADVEAALDEAEQARDNAYDAAAGDASDFLNDLETRSPSGASELRLLDLKKACYVSLRDVGVGISQVLPVLAIAFDSDHQLVAIEQPEIHLHPALQAELADVFIEAALSERQNTFILETHSEHLILRLMRRIREQKLSPDDVSVIFVEPQSQGSRFVELRMDEEGDFIDEWPGGFFEESFHEKFAGR